MKISEASRTTDVGIGATHSQQLWGNSSCHADLPSPACVGHACVLHSGVVKNMPNMVIDCPDYLLYVWDKCAKDSSIYYTYDDGIFTKESYLSYQINRHKIRQKMLNSSLLHFQVRPAVCVQDLCDTHFWKELPGKWELISRTVTS